MSSRVTFSSLVGALLITVASSDLGAQVGREIAFASPRPHFVAAGAPDRPVEVRRAAALSGRVSLELVGVPVAAAIEELSRRADLEISYSSAALPKGKLVTLRAQDIAVATALTEMLLASELDVVVDSDGRLALVPCRHEVVRAQAQDTGSIAGRVTDEATGNPIVGAMVAVEGTQKSSTTGGDGRFRITGLESGTYTVRARYIGYAPLGVGVSVPAGGEVDVAFALEKALQVLDELVTVTPGGTQTQVKALPSPITVITADMIESQAPRNVQELFRQAVPGAVSWDLTSRPSQSTFSVRGSTTLNPGVTQTKVFVDGIQVASPDFNLIDPQSIDRIEVIRGPQAAAVYGSDAIGGVLQIFTKRGEAGSRPKIQGEVSYGFIQTGYASPEGAVRQKYAGSVRGGTADVTYDLGASYWRTGDWVPPAGELSAQSSPSVFGGVKYARGILALDLSGRYGVINQGGAFNPSLLESGFVPFSRPQFSVQTTTSSNLGAQLSVTPLPGWSHSVRVGVDNLSFSGEQQQPRFTTPADSLLQVSSVETSRRWISYSSALDFERPNVSGTLTAGFDHNSLPTLSVSTSQAVPGNPAFPSALALRLTSNNTGYFAQGQVGLRDAIFLTAGMRLEDNTEFGDLLDTPVSPRVGITFVRSIANATVKLRSSWGRAIRAPSPFNKLSAGPTTLPNPELAPERQQGWDAGVDVQFGGTGSLGVTYYHQRAQDLIQFVPLQAQPTPLNQFQNVGRVTNLGMEVEARIRVQWVDLRGTYAYSRARIDELGTHYTGDLVVGEQVRLTPKHTAGLLLAASLRSGTSLTAGGAYVGRYTHTDFEAMFRCLGGTGTCPPDFRFVRDYSDFIKLDVGITQRLSGRLSGLLKVDNLTNTAVPEQGNLFAVMGRLTTIGIRYGN